MFDVWIVKVSPLLLCLFSLAYLFVAVVVVDFFFLVQQLPGAKYKFVLMHIVHVIIETLYLTK